MLQYPVRLSKDDNDTVLVEFPDLPEAVTYGETMEEALAHARDALATAMETYIKDRREIPSPSPRSAGPMVALPALVAAKVYLYLSMRAGHVNKSELGRRLKWHPPQVDRLLDVHHGSQLDQLEAAFAALGKRIVVKVEDDASGTFKPYKLLAVARPAKRVFSAATRTLSLAKRPSRKVAAKKR